MLSIFKTLESLACCIATTTQADTGPRPFTKCAEAGILKNFKDGWFKNSNYVLKQHENLEEWLNASRLKQENDQKESLKDYRTYKVGFYSYFEDYMEFLSQNVT